MSRILESEFRKELYKNLVDAGYDKQEAQKIVGVKYFNALKESTLSVLQNIYNEVEVNQFNMLTDEFILKFNENINELNKMQEFIGN
jgi:hypothetical protein